MDAYPKPAVDPVIPLTPAAVKRLLGIDLSPEQIASLLTALEFECRIEDGAVVAKTPPNRMDIGEGVIGEADLLEEIARLYSYNKIPAARLAQGLPPQRGNKALENEERVRDILVTLGLQEIMSYRMTTPEREARLRAVGHRRSGAALHSPGQPDHPRAQRDAPLAVGLRDGCRRAQCAPEPPPGILRDWAGVLAGGRPDAAG